MKRGLLALVLVALLALPGCGGGDDDSTTAPEADGGAQSGSSAGGAAGGRPGQDGEGDGGGSSQANDRGSADDAGAAPGGAGAQGGGSAAEVDLSVRPQSIKGARVTQTGAVQTLPPKPQAQETAQKNTYGSIRDFGAEAEGEEATNITFALVQYLTAKAQGDWATACARIYSVLRANLEDPEQGKGCPETFGQLISRSPQASRTEQAQIDVSSVRRGEGNRAFVIYKTPRTLSADMPMYVEDGVWKVGAIEAYALTPDQVG